MSEQSSSTDATQTPAVNVLELVRSQSGFLFVWMTFTGSAGTEDVLAMVDFGDPTPISMSGSLARRIGVDLAPTGETGYHADGTAFEVFEGVVPHVEVGIEHLDEVPVTSGRGELEFVARAIDFPFDAAVGWGFVSRYHFRFDYDEAVLVLSDDPIEAENPAFSVEADHPVYLRIPVELDGHPTRLILDTGSSHNVLDRAAAEALLRSPLSTLAPLELELGGMTTPQDFVLQDLPVLAQLDVIGVLGGAFLRDWIMDVPKGERTLTFQPRNP